MNSTLSVQELINFLHVSLGKSAGTDLFFYWLEEEYRFIREKPWAWNWSQHRVLTWAAISEPAVRFTWVEGNNYIQGNGVLSLDSKITGRKVKLGDEYYRVTNYYEAVNTRVYLDREILGSQSDLTECVFVRDEYAVPTTRIDAVFVDDQKLERLSKHYIRQHFFGRLSPEPGSAQAYIDRDDINLRPTPPGYAPVATDPGAGPVVHTTGKYVYFCTRYDVESKIESAPGPSLEYNNVTGRVPTLTYGNPAGNTLEDTSHRLRYYRSLRDPVRDRVAMFLIDERVPGIPPGATNDNTPDTVLKTRARYYDGSYCIIQLWPPPTDTRQSLKVEHVAAWGGRPYEGDYLDLGRNDELLDLLRIFLRGVIDLQNANSEEHRKASAVHRSQVEYLLTKSRASADGDAGPESYFPAVAGPEGSETGDWVNNLPWKD